MKLSPVFKCKQACQASLAGADVLLFAVLLSAAVVSSPAQEVQGSAGQNSTQLPPELRNRVNRPVTTNQPASQSSPADDQQKNAQSANQPYLPPQPPQGSSSPSQDNSMGRGKIKFAFRSSSSRVTNTATAPQTVPVDNTAAAPFPSGGENNSYIIKKHDTLWDIAHALLGNPFAWPKIWEKNRYIQNPNLIYPGNTLLLSGDGTISAANSAENSTANSTTGSSGPGGGLNLSFERATAGFLDKSKTSETDDRLLNPNDAAEQSLAAAKSPAAAPSPAAADTITPAEFDTIRALIEKKVLTSQFLMNSAFLWTEKDSRGEIYPGDARVDPDSKKPLYQQYDECLIKPYAKANYKEGDTLDIFKSDTMITFGRRTANLVRRIAQAQVTSVKGKEIRAILFYVHDVVCAGDRVAKATSMKGFILTGFTDPPSAISSQVVVRVEKSLFPYLFTSFIIDRGTQDGVQMGDLFASRRVSNRQPDQLGFATWVGDHYSTLVIVNLAGTQLLSGDRFDLIKRLSAN
jgi:hypothetical protein